MKCNIIATGNSLRDFNFSTLEGFTIGINFAWRHCPCDIVVGLDHPIKHRWGIGLEPEKIYTNKVHGIGNGLEKKGRGLQREKGYIAGDYNGSLYAAIDVALSMGYKELHVYGADEDLKDGYIHFYDEQPVGGHMRRRYYATFDKFREYRKKVKQQLKEDEKIIFH